MLVHKLIKVGHSFAITIPTAIVREMKLQRGDALILGLTNDNLLVIGSLDDREKLLLIGAKNSPLTNKPWAGSRPRNGILWGGDAAPAKSAEGVLNENI